MTEQTNKIQTVKLLIKQLPHGEGLPLPEYQTPGASGFDVTAAIAKNEKINLQPGQRELIPTGLAFEIPLGFEAQARPRSGLAIKNGVTLINSPGTIDADYRGEVKIPLINLGSETFVIERGMRIAQIIIQQIVQAEFSLVTELSATSRGAGGFGSTGV